MGDLYAHAVIHYLAYFFIKKTVLYLNIRSVAKQLESAGEVIPESFDCVTIYFSDIVGFTTLAAMSTPIEVLEFKNRNHPNEDFTSRIKSY